MFALETNSLTKFAFAVTIIVLFGACSSPTRKRADADDQRIIPVSEFGPGESWRDQYEPPVQYASKEDFRKRVKTGKSRKSVYTTQR